MVFAIHDRLTYITKSQETFQVWFVITNIDEAGNIFGTVCKKYYIDVLKKEPGINNWSDIKG